MYHFNKSLWLLPESVRKMFESKEVSRADKTKLVNSVVEHTSDGKYVVNPDAPMISLLSKSYTNVVGQELRTLACQRHSWLRNWGVKQPS